MRLSWRIAIIVTGLLVCVMVLLQMVQSDRMFRIFTKQNEKTLKQLRLIDSHLADAVRAFSSRTLPGPNTEPPSDQSSVHPSPQVRKDRGGIMRSRYRSDPPTLAAWLDKGDAFAGYVNFWVCESFASRRFENPDEWEPQLATDWSLTQETSLYFTTQSAAESAEKALLAAKDKWPEMGLEQLARDGSVLQMVLAEGGLDYQDVLFSIINKKPLRRYSLIAVSLLPEKNWSEGGKEVLADSALEKIQDLLRRHGWADRLIYHHKSHKYLLQLGVLDEPTPIIDAINKELLRAGGAGDADAQKDDSLGKAVLRYTGLSRDEILMTFNLRRGVKWHDGEDFTVKDVLFTFNTIMNPGVQAVVARGYMMGFAGIEVLDDWKIRIRWNEPYFGAFGTVAGTTIIPEHVFHFDPNDPRQFNEHKNQRHPIGTGPFRFERWIPNKEIVLVRNDDYWGQVPYLSELRHICIKEDEVAFQELLKGNLDTLVVTPEQWRNNTSSKDFLRRFRSFRLHVDYWICSQGVRNIVACHFNLFILKKNLL